MKKPDFFNKATAEKLGISLKIVKEVNTWYWRYGVKRNLSQANYNAIFLKNFGTIVVSRRKINAEIFDVIQTIRNIRKSTWLTEKRKGLILEQLNVTLGTLLKRRNEIANDYYNKKKLRNEQKLANRISKVNTEGNS